VALTALKGEMTLSDLAQRFDVHRQRQSAPSNPPAKFATESYHRSRFHTPWTHKGDKERILSEGIETEITPAVWVTRATATTKSKTTLTLQFQAQKAISCGQKTDPTVKSACDRRRREQLASLLDAIL